MPENLKQGEAEIKGNKGRNSKRIKSVDTERSYAPGCSIIPSGALLSFPSLLSLQFHSNIDHIYPTSSSAHP